MSKYLTLHQTQAAYDAVKDSLPTPQVALVKENMTVNYKPYVPQHDYSQDYLTFTATQSGTFKFIGYNSINYSLDGGETWTPLARNTNSPTVSAGNKILWKATLTATSEGIGKFSSTANFTVEGNLMSLLYGDNFANQTSLSGKGYAFAYLFGNCTRLTSAENLSLLATTLAEGCYFGMFYGCESLTTAPQLLATTLAKNCYQEMFYGCSSLNSITCLATDISASKATLNWVDGVAASGTFTKASSMTSWTTGINGIPSGWTVRDAS